MAWLGHRSPASTQHYVAVAPTRLAKAYADADYFRRNVRLVEVLVDREAVTSGAAAAGAPWRFYDLGHGYCTYDFFDQCPHRMACAVRLYRPRARRRRSSSKADRPAPPARDSLRERAAVEDGIMTHERLLANGRRADPDGVATPARPEGGSQRPLTADSA
jgi:hypothetical protein